MTELSEKTCVACRIGAPLATEEEIKSFMPQIPEWEIINVDGVNQLTRIFKFKDFTQAMQFTNLVGNLAESENHHPAILTEWGRVKVSWWSHKIKGLHVNDFVMAAKTDLLLNQMA
jgi:4a-hydroxytetrahydrobiopterin dehydratase